MTEHTLILTPQSVVDGWEAECSCGKWQKFKSFYEINNKDDLIASLRKEYEGHLRASGQQTGNSK